ncbi:TIGR02611 family protein [Mycobacterium vulneris]|uniref:TIGR02611 family protein n=1 Tax=Mycolicibacterium porcinum TaxID=39693 RepID=A0AAW5TF93_9MYCO|nr:TIGR02611 family protein [Mycolicibacterium porcinum]MBX8686756.1 TIGR02611 family protein [Mycobacterium sp. 20091114027_K0903767]OCB41781.1 TIGR02611 family protein [Mycolicibacterium vulneris]MCV7392752.1 TIGR02611 family protein [Mycolicibacterium porcinum]OCB55600.1 TIGR02611 family protein [Mycolicibacterium vulneris]OCB65514.1 TIGR02611 family protein [Mycolicibacterium vulneris]
MSLATNLTALKQRWTGWRERLRSRPVADFTYRIVIGVVGTLVLAVGIVAIPYPGPGWAIVFLGLAILASEFDFAKRALRYVRARYDAVMAWFDRQHIAVKGVSAAFTGLVVVGTLWLFGVVGFAAGLVGLEQEWLKSPLGMGS